MTQRKAIQYAVDDISWTFLKPHSGEWSGCYILVSEDAYGTIYHETGPLEHFSFLTNEQREEIKKFFN